MNTALDNRIRQATKRTTKADLLLALRAIASIPQAYHSQGPAVVRDEMARTANQALIGAWAGVARSVS